MKAEVVEVLEHYTRDEIAAQLIIWQEALEAKDDWDKLSESEKDEAFEQAE